MEEQLITIKTSKIAKEKGFNIESNGFYYPIKNINENIIGDIDVETLRYSLNDSSGIEFKKSNNYALVPTQNLLQKWLRDIHGLEIEIQVNPHETPKKYIGFVGYSDVCVSDSYEDTLEECLQKAIELIKVKNNYCVKRSNKWTDSEKIMFNDLTEDEAKTKVRELMLAEPDTMSVTYFYRSLTK